MFIFGDPVSGLQFFGYSIALGGLVYYKLGGDGIKNSVRDSQIAWSTIRQNNPARAKAVVVGAVLAAVMLVLFMVWPTVPTDYKKSHFS